ncbi:superoxide dismutase family protein [Thalassobacillus sp. CUG 92003]|uniref:superoxide dismutase family protein n=1 Tax=Thalassobacillus sp. CUG 92003 TaxID=2736641 RepID=UPI0015E78C8B|nr:superoxide dismutase family protein [Thalassobacillus sp. CUG 92003]
MKRWFYLVAVLGLVLVLSACGSDSEEGNDTEGNNEETSMNEDENTETNSESGEQEQSSSDMVTVKLQNTEGEQVGTAKLEQQESGVAINLEASDLPPGQHGFHIHETGMCETPDFKSAGGHFNPTNASHGTEHEDGPHAGDLPNIEVNEDGTIQKEITADKVTLTSGEDNSLLGSDGTALVIHEKADDKQSQPSGAAGSRIACGTISE